MKNIKLIVTVFLIGMLAAGSAFAQERQDRQGQQQDQQRQQQEQQDRQRQQQDQFRGDRAQGVDQLPQAVQETLRDDYEDYRATEASRTSDPNEDEPFFMVKLISQEEDEPNKVVMINNDGEVIEEEEIMIREHRRDYDRDQQRRDDQRRGDGQIFDDQRRDGQRDDQQRDGQRREDDQQRDREGRQYTPVSFVQDDRRQEQSAATDSLPQQVESKLMQDFADWSPTEAHLATDPERGTTYYIVKMHNVAEGQTKLVRITGHGEVIDEERINPLDGIDDAERRRDTRDDDNDNDNDDGWF
jgi:hypothetical protein